MKRFLQQGFLLSAIWLLSSQMVFAIGSHSVTSSDQLVIRYTDAQGAPILRASTTLPNVIHLNGTGAEATISVSAKGLMQDITLSVGPGFEVTPTSIAADNEDAQVIVRHTSCRKHTDGRLILRSGDIRTYVAISAEGTPLSTKDLSTLPSTPPSTAPSCSVFDGSAVESQTFEATSLSDKGYTIEIKARTDDPSKSVLPYAVTASGLGFKSYIRSTSMGLMNGKNVFVSEKGLSNPANGGTFYNTDGLFHTYRYAVTPDRRIFVYRDGLPVDTFRVADLALQPEWSETSGNMLPNLIKNGDFEGEYNFSESQNITKFIEGWDVYPYDQYNSYQDIEREERSNEVDQNNHVLSIHRYMWNDGWADAEISQIVDVAPNETYAFSALAKGGQYSGSALGSIRIQDLQNDANNVRLNVTSDSYQTYASDFETKANTKQVRVTFQLGRAKWGASTSAFKVDDVKMVGVSRIPTAQVGFENLGADIQYFAIDPTGAYAPPFAAITTSKDALVINGTGASQTFTVSAENLTGDITLTATHGFEVTPKILPAGAQNATVTVRHLTTLIENTGRIILRSGDIHKEVHITAYGSPLDVKDIVASSATPSTPPSTAPSCSVFDGSAVESQTFDATALSDKGYTIEIKARTDDPSKSVLPYAVTASGLGFKSYIRSTSMGLMNGKNVFVSEKGLSNPANGGTFYNTDGLFHTYRYAVTPDRRIFVYRDGLPIDTFRVADLALQPEWSETSGNMLPNLIKNGDFEGEYNFSESQNITKFIEGWDVYPYDQYNSYQDIDREERSNEVDQNNHVLSIHRYMWNDGWADAEISQIVDVAPNETYAFSALAKGGQYSGSALGSIRIQDLQNDANNVRLNVTSDSYQTYASDFETKANTKQVRVTFQLGRAKWGASTSAFKVDDVKMVGVSRIPTAQVGFENLGADIQYFAIDPTGAYAPPFAAITTSKDALVINGTGASQTFTVSAENLTGDITLTATHGFEVTPKILPAGTQNATVTVKHLTTLIENTGRIILRSGDIRKEVHITAYGSPLDVKDIVASSATPSATPSTPPSTAPSCSVFDGSAVESQTFDATSLSDKGYTIEIKARTDDPSKSVLPYAVTASGLGFKSYIRSTSMGLMNGKNVFVSEKGLSNPANGGTFYNTDGLFHTYRYAVTPDRRIFVYRDGLPIDTFRVADLALQPEWSETSGNMLPNLIKNGDFEGEYNFSESQNITKFIEGWDVYPYDQYNSYQDIDREERSNEVDQNNHVLSIHRYMWNDGWADAEISQIVDVAPNETYAFSALAKGGQYSGSALGSIRIQDLQNDANNVRLNVTSDSYQTYASDFETKANTKQVRVTFQLGRAKWGASTSAFKVDDVKMVGVSRIPTAQVGFENLGADIQYFAIDPTGAYAPPFATLATNSDALTIKGTGASGTFTVSATNLTGDITLTATHGFEVTPKILPAGTQNATVTVKHLTTLIENTGRIILRSGDIRKEVHITAYGSPLDVKDIVASSATPTTPPSTAPSCSVFNGSAVESQAFDATSLSDKGYTIEIKARTDDPSKSVLPYAVTASGLGFKSYIRSTSMGLMNGKNVFVSEKGLSNPANGGTFYNTDGLFHTYRYAVTPDRRIFVYRDGLPIDTFRVADLALQPEWSETNGPVVKNLLKNGDFEGEYNFSESQNITKFIEGWDVYPYDQYNSYQDIDREERSNEVDQNNHVLSIHRYMWNDGWADAEISQIVDVASDDIYTFSALAKGGQYSGSALGSIRIQDLQNDDNNARLNVTSDSYQKYSVDFETKANTKQIRITFQLGRAKWGASTSAFKIDDARLVGTSRIPTAQLGFENLGADIEYFAFDASGAYAPTLPGLTVKDIQDAIQTAHSTDGNIRGHIVSRRLQLLGVEDHSRVVVYDPSGQEVTAVNDYRGQTAIALPRRGIYIVAVFKDGKRKVIKVM